MAVVTATEATLVVAPWTGKLFLITASTKPSTVFMPLAGFLAGPPTNSPVSSALIVSALL